MVRGGRSEFLAIRGNGLNSEGVNPAPLLPTSALSTVPLPAGGATILRLVSGDISQIQTGRLIPATVVQAGGGQAVLSVAGQQVTVRGAMALVPGDVLRVRVEPGANPAVAVVGREATGVGATGEAVIGRTAVPVDSPAVGRASPNPVPPPSVSTSEPVVVDVLARQPDGQLQVRIDGQELPATSRQPLQPGGRYVVQLDRTPAGIVLRPLPDSPQLPATVATAILRTDKPPPLGDTLPSLVRELTTPPAGEKVQAAAAEVREAAVKLLPPADQPPTAETLKHLVEDGGTHFEAKLARAADPTTPDRPAVPAPGTDLKGGLLSLARTVTDLAAAFPAAAATLHGIERQQATNVLAQQNGGMAVFQIPFPDGPHWRTLGLGIEPDRSGQPDSTGRPTGFRVMMHVPLTTLGETWIDASAEANRLRAVLYVSDAAARERVRGELPELRGELLAGGFADVALDVRVAADLTDAQRRKANAVREGVPEGGGILDVRA